jgi:hypothetical protein
MHACVHSQLNDMRMPQQLQVLDLALYPAGHVSGHQPLPVDNLQGDLLAADLVRRQLDLAERALAQRLHDCVLSQALAGLGVPALALLHDGSRRNGRCSKVDGAGGAACTPPWVRHGYGELLEILIVYRG